MTSNITWVVDTYLLDNAQYEMPQHFPDVVKSLGYNCITTKYVPFSDWNESLDGLDHTRPIIMYGTHNFIKQARKAKSLVPGDYCNEQNLKCSEWMTRYPKDWLMNADCHWLPFGLLSSLIPTKSLFLRPDSVGKLFAGRTVKPEDFGEELKKIDDTSGVNNSTMIVVNDLVAIHAEYRFFVAEGIVVAGSQYRRDGKLDIRADYSDAAKVMADKVATYEWQPDRCYVVDIAETDDGAKIIELNSMSCAGTYACDLAPIIDSVSKAALSEWEEIFN